MTAEFIMEISSDPCQLLDVVTRYALFDLPVLVGIKGSGKKLFVISGDEGINFLRFHEWWRHTLHWQRKIAVLFNYDCGVFEVLRIFLKGGGTTYTDRGKLQFKPEVLELQIPDSLMFLNYFKGYLGMFVMIIYLEGLCNHFVTQTVLTISV